MKPTHLRTTITVRLLTVFYEAKRISLSLPRPPIRHIASEEKIGTRDAIFLPKIPASVNVSAVLLDGQTKPSFQTTWASTLSRPSTRKKSRQKLINALQKQTPPPPTDNHLSSLRSTLPPSHSSTEGSRPSHSLVLSLSKYPLRNCEFI